MHSGFHRALPVLLFLAAGLVVLASAGTPPASAQTGEIRLSYAIPMGPGDGAHPANGIPTDCSYWHELYPNYCVMHHQDFYWDNGDGVVSPCDYIVLDGVCYHITWVGPTYYMTRMTPAPSVTRVAEPVQTNTGESPVCETWHEVYPNFCHEFHVDSWYDVNSNQKLDACDEIDLQPPQVPTTEIWHIDRIALDIKVVPGPTPVRPGTWGRLKTLYR